MQFVIYGIIVIALVILVRNIRIVPQAQAYVITRLGAYKTTWGVGLHLKVPFIEAVAKRLSLKEQVADFPPQLPDHRPEALHLRHRAADPCDREPLGNDAA